jgi:predicted nucleic acid-binding protein
LIVLDASLALKWSHADERTPAVMDLSYRVAREGAVVPAMWIIEIANGLEMAVRKKRISVAVRDELIANFKRLKLEVEDTSSERVWGAALGLAHRHNLTVYDAGYLELAARRRLPLGTLDDELIAAAHAEGVAVLP